MLDLLPDAVANVLGIDLAEYKTRIDNYYAEKAAALKAEVENDCLKKLNLIETTRAEMLAEIAKERRSFDELKFQLLEIRGSIKDGKDGTSVSIAEVRGMIENEEFPALYIDRSGQLCQPRRNGSVHVLGIVEGKTGETGPRGEQGEKGDPGEKGETGERGLQGETGERGEPGPIGPIGLMGEKGERGERGEQGQEGPIGPVGERGLQGEIGPIGERGPTGDMGPDGPVGPVGERGLQGEMGPAGQTGERGDIGPEGQRGLQGEVGPMGLQGERGLDGPVGPSGERGEMGPRGEMGMKGMDGRDGRDGTPGGPPGPEGPMGPAGLSMTYEDIYTQSRSYTPGQFVTFGGSLWCCKKATSSKPGEGSDWKLAVKKGRDAPRDRD